MKSSSHDWFPIHLHLLPRTMTAPLAGAVVSLEWRSTPLAAAYDWHEPWPSKPGERLLAFVRRWQDLTAHSHLATAENIRFSVEGENDFGDLGFLEPLQKMGLIWVDIFRSDSNRYFAMQTGLTADGNLLLAEMERLGLGLDLTHLPEAALPHVLAVWSGRRVVSHVVAGDLLEWSLWQPPNAWSDQGLLSCDAELYGIPFVDDIVSLRKVVSRKTREASIETVARHILYVSRVVGADKVTLGPDFFDYRVWKTKGIEIGTVDGLEHPDGLAALFQALLRGGMDESEARGVFWQNAQRVVTAWGRQKVAV